MTLIDQALFLWWTDLLLEPIFKKKVNYSMFIISNYLKELHKYTRKQDREFHMTQFRYLQNIDCVKMKTIRNRGEKKF